jgi:hypothetical protein
MITTAGKGRIASLIDADLGNGELGISSQAPSVSDTDLILETTSTIEALDGTVSGRQIIIDYNINSITGNGNTYTEYGNFMSDDTLLSRSTFTGVPKNSAIEFQVKTILNVN